MIGIDSNSNDFQPQLIYTGINGDTSVMNLEAILPLRSGTL